MRRLSFFLLLATAILAVIAPGKPADFLLASSDRSDAWERELRQADIEFANQTALRRLDGWMEFFADDASTIHDGQTVTGKDALRKYYEPVFADTGFQLSWKPTHAEASRDGTLGYTFGDYEAKRGANISRGMYVTVWRRVNGRWKVALDLGSAARRQP